MQGSLTLLFVIVTVLVSLAAFRNVGLINKLILWPAVMNKPAEYHRLLSSGFIHADSMHLIFNMFTLYFIGSYVEHYFALIDNKFAYLLLYLGGIVVASLPSFFKHRNNHYFRSLGASGGVAAVLFSMVYISPWEGLYIFGILPIPSIVFAILYLIYSAYMSRRGGDHINHDAHFWGAVFGFCFTWIVSPQPGQLFLRQIMNPF